MAGKALIDQQEGAGEEGVDKEPPLVVIEEGSPEHVAVQRGEEREDDEDGGEEGAADTDERIGSGREPTEEHQLYGRRREGETEEQYKERRRKERKQKKVNQRAARDRTQTELRYLDQRNDQLERESIELKKRLSKLEQGHGQNQALLVDNRMETLKGQLAEADRLLAAAIEAQAGQDVVDCNRIRDHLNKQIGQLEAYKEHLARGGQAQQRQSANGGEQEEQQGRPQVRQAPDPKVAAHSREFQERLEWFDPRGRDPESATVYAIDVALSKDKNFDPRTKKYWDELHRRVKAAMPHKFEGEEPDDLDDDEQDERDDGEDRRQGNGRAGGGPRMPGGNRSSARGTTTFVLSKDRKEALIEAGVWEDPKLRDKYIRRYREYDKAQAASSRR